MKSVAILAATFAAAVSPFAASAQDFPSKPIRLILPIAAGGPTDISTRLMAAGMTQKLGQPIVIENRPGAGSAVGLAAIAAAAPDGYTIGVTSSTMTMLPASMKGFTLDPTKDFTPIAQIAEGAMSLVAHPSVPVTSVKDLIAYAKANPGKLNFGAPSGQLIFRLFNAMAGVDITVVPYKGLPASMAALQANDVQLGVENVAAIKSLVPAGKLRLLASTGRQRLAEFPDTPTISESGVPGYAYVWWFCVIGPANIPANIVARLNEGVVAGTSAPDYVKRMPDFGGRAVGSSPSELAKIIATETAQWTRTAREAGIKPE